MDIHCHYLNPEAAAKVADRNPGQYEGMEHPLDFIGGTPGISPGDKDRIMGANAARLLKIDYNAPTRRRKT